MNTYYGVMCEGDVLAMGWSRPNEALDWVQETCGFEELEDAVLEVFEYKVIRRVVARREYVLEDVTHGS